MELAKRRFSIDSSGIRKVFGLAAQMKNPINLSIGQPDFDVPEAVKDAAIDAIRAGKNRYTLTGGIPPLREGVKNYFKKRNVPVENTMISSGTSGALVLLLMALVDPGDDVLVPDPYFVMYKHLTHLMGARAVYVDTYPDFRLTKERLEAALTPRTKAIMLNTPSNPTGVVYTEEECRMIAEFCEEHGIWAIIDEIYEPYCYDDDFVSPAQFMKKPVVVGGMSKSVAMTGWRIGWVGAPEEVIQGIQDIQQYTFVCAPSMAQEAALAALEYDTSEIRAQYRKRRDVIYEGLANAGYEVEKPGGAFYIFPKAPNGDGDTFVPEAIKNNLLIVPGSVFSEKKTHFRISFAATIETLEKGIDVLAKLKKQYDRP